MNSNWLYCPETANLGHNFFFCVTLKFYRWPWKTIGHLFYATSCFVHEFKATIKSKLKLQSDKVYTLPYVLMSGRHFYPKKNAIENNTVVKPKPFQTGAHCPLNKQSIRADQHTVELSHICYIFGIMAISFPVPAELSVKPDAFFPNSIYGATNNAYANEKGNYWIVSLVWHFFMYNSSQNKRQIANDQRVPQECNDSKYLKTLFIASRSIKEQIKATRPIQLC